MVFNALVWRQHIYMICVCCIDWGSSPYSCQENPGAGQEVFIPLLKAGMQENIITLACTSVLYLIRSGDRPGLLFCNAQR